MEARHHAAPLAWLTVNGELGTVAGWLLQCRPAHIVVPQICRSKFLPVLTLDTTEHRKPYVFLSRSAKPAVALSRSLGAAFMGACDLKLSFRGLWTLNRTSSEPIFEVSNVTPKLRRSKLLNTRRLTLRARSSRRVKTRKRAGLGQRVWAIEKPSTERRRNWEETQISFWPQDSGSLSPLKAYTRPFPSGQKASGSLEMKLRMRTRTRWPTMFKQSANSPKCF